MQIKNFSARSSKEVLSQIKEQLGPDAVILDTQEEDGVITMTAALERAPLHFGESAGEGHGFEPVGGRPARHNPRQQGRAHNAVYPDGGDSLGPQVQDFSLVYTPRQGQPQDGVPLREAPGRGRTHPQADERPQAGTRMAGQTRPSPRMAFQSTPAASKGNGQSAAMAQAAPMSRAAASLAARQSARATLPPAPGSVTRTATGRPLAQIPSNGSGKAAAMPAVPAAAQPGIYGGPPPGWQDWHDEWSNIRDHLLALMKPALRLDLLPPRQRLAVEFLQREGVEDAAMLHLFQRLQADPGASILGPLGQLVPVRSWSEEAWPQRLQMIAGPFGAGKTSVAIRLALSLRRTSPHCRICLVNADATRGNGRLLLRHYCELSDMAYKEASSTLELVSSLNEALREKYDRVIVDLPGFSRGRFLNSLISDAGLEEATGEGAGDLAVHLALPPHYSTLQLQGVLERYRVPHAGSIVWTKLDEAEHYGQIVNVAIGTGLPVSALSFGPGLGNSLAPAKENMLWRLLFKRELPLS